MAGGFLVDQIAAHDHELLARYTDFVRCEQLDPEANHRYAITILHGHRNPERCRLLPPALPNAVPDVQYYMGNPPRPIPTHSEQPLGHSGRLRTCRILDNGVHVHQYGKQGGEYTLRVLEVVVGPQS
jgi:hypothetical protein